MGLLRQIAHKVDPRSLSSECRGGKCYLTLGGLDPTQYILVGMDGPNSPVPQTVTRCDFIFFGSIPESGHFWTSPIELTASTNKSSTSIIGQLRAGGRLAEALAPSDEDVKFAPIAAGPFNKFRRLEFRRSENRIGFRGSLVFPIAVSCSSGLIDALATGGV